MLSMMQINQSLKENFERQLQDITDLPEDLARGYKAWVQGVVMQAAQQIQANVQQQQAPEQQGA